MKDKSVYPFGGLRTGSGLIEELTIRGDKAHPHIPSP
jgi:hypothetical protein